MQSDLARPLLEGEQVSPGQDEHASCSKRAPGIVAALSVVTMHLMVGTALFYNLRPDGMSDLASSFYFACTTFATIGYGDIHPNTPASKVFFMVYIVVSLALQASVGGYIVASVMSVRKAEQLPDSRQAQTNMYLRIRPKLVSLVYAAATLVALVAVGSTMLHVMDGRDWLDSVYWSCVTLTTVGYGDITPTSHKVIFAVYCLVGVLAFANVFAEIISTVVEVQMIWRLQAFFQNGFDRNMLDRMDGYKDGEISRYEFVLFMLRDMDIASSEQIERITGIFDSLDVNRDGVLNTQDIRKRCNGPRHLPASTSVQAGPASSGLPGASIPQDERAPVASHAEPQRSRDEQDL